MNIKISSILIAGGVVVAGLLLWVAMTTFQLNTASTELAAAKTALTAAQTELTQSQNELAAAKIQLGNTQGALAAKTTELSGVRTELAGARTALDASEKSLSAKTAELATVKNNLVSANSQLASATSELNTTQTTLEATQTTLTQTQQQLTLSQNTLRGLGVSIAASVDCTDVVLVDNPNAADPTLNQLLSFLAQDKTENHNYILNVYDCSQFSRDLHNNAEAAGIRAAEVQLWFTNSNTGHALDAFLTTDYGLVYVDDTSSPDTFSRVKVYKTYRGTEVGNVAPANLRNDAWWDSLRSYYYITTEYGTQAILQDITIYW